ncbi:MAG: ATP-binding protein [Acidobacteriota bacterium]
MDTPDSAFAAGPKPASADRHPTWLWWSSGKDSAWALHVLRRGRRFDVTALVTTVEAAADRTAVHGVRGSILREQAKALGLPLLRMEIPYPCPNEVYEAAVADMVERARRAGVAHMAFGDLFLDDIRDYRRRLFEATSVEPIFPLWGQDTGELAESMIDGGLRARLVGIDTRVLAPTFLGRAFDRGLLDDLPPGVDPCGENGEFHTLVIDGPGFSRPLDVTRGRVLEARSTGLRVDFEGVGRVGVA